MSDKDPFSGWTNQKTPDKTRRDASDAAELYRQRLKERIKKIYEPKKPAESTEKEEQ